MDAGKYPHLYNWSHPFGLFVGVALLCNRMLTLTHTTWTLSTNSTQHFTQYYFSKQLTKFIFGSAISFLVALIHGLANGDFNFGRRKKNLLWQGVQMWVMQGKWRIGWCIVIGNHAVYKITSIAFHHWLTRPTGEWVPFDLVPIYLQAA